MNHRGWRRVGIVLSGLWAVGVIGVAALQRFADPPVAGGFTRLVYAKPPPNTAAPQVAVEERVPEWAKAPVVKGADAASVPNWARAPIVKEELPPDFAAFVEHGPWEDYKERPGSKAREVIGVTLRPKRVLAVLFIPLVAFWLVSYAAVGTALWVRDGFRPPGK